MITMTSLRTPLLLAVFAASTTARVAYANGRYPATNQILVQPGNAARLALRTTFGVLRSDDSGKTWDWVCEKAVGYAGVEDPALVWHRNGELVAGLFDGLATADEASCTWTSSATIGKQVVVDVSTANADATSLDALTGGYDPTSPTGDPGYISAVWSTAGDARTWTQTSSLMPRDVIVESFDRAPSDPQRIYVTGEAEAGTERSGVILVSRDGGQSWTRKAFALDTATERSVFLAAIDPRRPDRLYVRTIATDAGRVLVSDDAGDSFRVVWSGSAPQGFAINGDGSTVWVGAFNEGLARASSTDFAFTNVNRVPIGCLRYAEGALYACSLDAYGFAAARSDDEGRTFEPLLHLASIRGPRVCGGDAGQSVCAAEWSIVKANVGIVDAVDAGAVPVFDAGATPPASTSRSCGCAVVGAADENKSATAAWLVAGATVALVRKRRRITS